jgi:hypothetical protein
MPAPTNGRVAHSPSGPSLSPNAPATNNLLCKDPGCYRVRLDCHRYDRISSIPPLFPLPLLRPLIPPVPHPGRAAEAMGDLDRALGAYERALIINSQSWAALTMAAHVCRCKEDYGRVSPVSTASLSPCPSPFPPYPGSCVCAHITLSRFAMQQSAPPPLLLCVAVEPWRQAASNITIKDCRCVCLCMCVRVSVCVCVCICLQISLHF